MGDGAWGMGNEWGEQLSFSALCAGWYKTFAHDRDFAQQWSFYGETVSQYHVQGSFLAILSRPCT